MWPRTVIVAVCEQRVTGKKGEVYVTLSFNLVTVRWPGILFYFLNKNTEQLSGFPGWNLWFVFTDLYFN